MFIVTLGGVAQQLWDHPKDKRFSGGPILGESSEQAPGITMFGTAAEAYAAIGRTVAYLFGEGARVGGVNPREVAFNVVPLMEPAR